MKRFLPMMLVAAGLFARVAAGAEAGLPRIMLLMDEKTIGGYSVDEAELQLARYFTERGCAVVDAELVKSRLDRDQALQALAGSAAAAAALGLDFGADIIVVGRAVAKGSAREIETTGLRSYRGTVTAKAIRTDSAVIVAMGEGTAAQAHTDDTAGGSAAIAEATRKLANELYPALLAAWTGAAPETASKIELVVADVRQVWQLAALQRILQDKVPDVRGVVRRSFVSGVATYEIETGRNPDAVAQALTLVKDEPFRFQVSGISATKIDAKIVAGE